MDIRWIENVRAQFIRVYGKARGEKVCNVVIPAVMGDFRKTVLASEPGVPVTEQYRTDDRKTDVTVTGRRLTRAGREVCAIERIEVGGKPVPLGTDALIL